MGTFRRSQGDRSSHVKHLLRWQSSNVLGRSRLGSHDTLFAERSMLPLTVTDHTAPARGQTLRLLQREYAQLALHLTSAVCDQTGAFSEAIMIATCSSTLANSICDSAPQRSRWPRPDLWSCVSSLHVNPPCQRTLVWCVRHEDSNEIVSFQEKLHLALDAHILE